MGRRFRPHDGYNRRPHNHPLGQVPPLPAVGGCSLLRVRNTALHHTRLELRRQNAVGVCDLCADDDSVHRHKRALRRYARRGERQFARKNRVLLFPHVFRLRRLIHRPGFMGAALRHVRAFVGLLGAVELASSHGGHSCCLLCAVCVLLQAHPRADKDCVAGRDWQGFQGSDAKPPLVDSHRSRAVVQHLLYGGAVPRWHISLPTSSGPTPT